MSILEHNRRSTVFGAHQHPFAHDIDEFPYTHPAYTGSTVQAALDWLFAVLYPNQQPAVATENDLPTVGNNLNDMRVVLDYNNTGLASSFRWEQREGDVAPQWYRIYSLDWGEDSVLSNFLNQTQDVYVYKYGIDQLDENGVPVAGDLAGQYIYGGNSANTNLTLFANSGDGVGPPTGYVQFGDNARPLVHNTQSLGTATYRFADFYSVLANIGDFSFAGSQMTSSTNVVSFGDNNLLTTGTATIGSMLLGSGSITDTSGTISFGNENLSTTGTVGGGVATFTSVQATGAASAFANATTIGTLVFGGNTITDPGGTVSFGDEILVTTGYMQAAEFRAPLFTVTGVNSVAIDSNRFRTTATNYTFDNTTVTDTFTFENPLIANNDLTANGTIQFEGSTRMDTFTFDGQSITTLGGVFWDIAGTEMTINKRIRPTLTTVDLGSFSDRFRDIFLSGNIRDGTNITPISVIMSLRDILVTAAEGHAIFWDNAQSKFITSIPDLEVNHGTIQGLGDDDHTQYALLAGRTGGQTLYGSDTTAENLIIQANSADNTGYVGFGSNIQPTADFVRDLGAPTFRWNNLYMFGQGVGFRVQNGSPGSIGAAPSTAGRLLFDSGDIYVDIGGSWSKVGEGGLVPTVLSGAGNLANGNHYLAQGIAGYTVNLPDPPAAGTIIRITDAGMDWDVNNLTINPGTKKIDDLAVSETLVMDVSGLWVQFMWDGTQWWSDDPIAPTYPAVGNDKINPNVTQLNNTNNGYVAGVNDHLLCDTSVAGFTVNLIPTPTVGDRVTIMDSTESFGTSALTVGRNGSLLEGAAADGTLSRSGAMAEYVYMGGSIGWKDIQADITDNAASADVAATVTLAASVSPTNYPLMAQTATGDQPLYTSSSNLTFDATSGTLTTTTFAGSLSGNATSATTATNATNAANIGIATAAPGDATSYLTMVGSNTIGNQAPFVDTELVYNATSQTLSATNFSGALSGNASTATALSSTRTFELTGDVTGSTIVDLSAGMSIACTVANNSHTHDGTTISDLDAADVTTGIFATALIPTNINITGNANTASTLQTARTINGVSFNGSANIVVEAYIENDESTAATRYITFVDNTTAAYKRLNEDSSLTYNPSTNTLTAGAFIATTESTSSKTGFYLDGGPTFTGSGTTTRIMHNNGNLVLNATQGSSINLYAANIPMFEAGVTTLSGTRHYTGTVSTNVNGANFVFFPNGTQRWWLHCADNAFLYVLREGWPTGSGLYLASNGTSWTPYTSDERLKENITPLSAAYCEKALNFGPSNFNFIEDAPGTVRRGYIAQHVAAEYPELTEINPNTGYMTVKETEMVPILHGLIKAIEARVTALESA